MPKPSTYPLLFEDLNSLSIKDLKRLGFLEPDTMKSSAINWSYSGNIVASIWIVVDTSSLEIKLNYTATEGGERDYIIRLIKVPSNLGRGHRYYFICPVTLKKCTKLYLYGSYFVHRAVIREGLYSSQVKSHKERRLHTYLNAVFNGEKELNQKYAKYTYRGEPTKRYLRTIKKIRAGGELSDQVIADLKRRRK